MRRAVLALTSALLLGPASSVWSARLSTPQRGALSAQAARSTEISQTLDFLTATINDGVKGKRLSKQAASRFREEMDLIVRDFGLGRLKDRGKLAPDKHQQLMGELNGLITKVKRTIQGR